MYKYVCIHVADTHSLTLSTHQPSQQQVVVTKCNEDMEALITDPNRSIGTLAVTTLLRTGDEAGVDRLMKQVRRCGDMYDLFICMHIHTPRPPPLSPPTPRLILTPPPNKHTKTDFSLHDGHRRRVQDPHRGVHQAGPCLRTFMPVYMNDRNVH